MEKKVTSPLINALIITLSIAIIDIIAGFAHLRMETWYRWIPSLLFLLAIIWICINYSNQKKGDVTYGDVFSYGFKTSAISTCFSIIFALITLLIVFPDSKDQALEEARKQMEQQGRLSEENIDKAIDITRKFFMVFAIGGVVVFTLICGLIASLIGAAIAKKNPATPFENV